MPVTVLCDAGVILGLDAPPRLPFGRILMEMKTMGHNMQSEGHSSWRSLLVDKAALQELVLEQNKRIAFDPDPSATAIKAREQMLALGVVPSDNAASCGIIAAREE